LEADDKAFKNEFAIKLDQLGDDPVNFLANMLVELIQHDDYCYGDSNSPTGTCKLLPLKENIFKEIEKTKLEIDSLEGEFKSVNIYLKKPIFLIQKIVDI
jgi:nuclear receptor co-repressor 1